MAAAPPASIPSESPSTLKSPSSAPPSSNPTSAAVTPPSTKSPASAAPQHVKTRMSVADCVRMSSEVNHLLAGAWVQNIYTIEGDNKTFLFKLTGRDEKYVLLLESGVRFHPTSFLRDKSDAPSGFAMKLRKHVRGRRLEFVRQVGLDRVVDFVFAKGTDIHHVVLEMYAGGNVVLTDAKGMIMTLLRPYEVPLEGAEPDASGRRVAVGQIYPFDLASSTTAIGAAQEIASLSTPSSITRFLNDYVERVSEEETAAAAAAPAGNAKQQAGKAEGKKKSAKELEKARELVTCLSSKGSPAQSLGPQLLEHVLMLSELNPKSRVDVAFLRLPGIEKRIAEAIARCSGVLSSLADPDVASPGFISYAEPSVVDASATTTPALAYLAFEPIQYAVSTVSTLKTLSFPSFHEAVDEYYSKIEAQRDAKAKSAMQKQAEARVDQVRRDNEARLQALRQAVVDREEAAHSLAERIVDVDHAITIVNTLLAQGMSWEAVDQIVKNEKRANNPVAMLIRSLEFNENRMTVQVPRAGDETKLLPISIDLGKSAQANVSEVFQEMKKASSKAEATLDRAADVVKHLGQKERAKAAKQTNQATRSAVRLSHKPLWFERFLWFVTSEGVLVLAGKDAHQNETLVKKYLRKGDAYLHADQHGAPSCVVRNPYPNQPLPVESLSQAGVFCVCRSSAWQAKIITSAWWVEAHQVSRTAPTGEYLPTGSFMIRGKKNYLNFSRLEMGFGFIFKVEPLEKEEEEEEAAEEATPKEDPREKEWRLLRMRAKDPSASIEHVVATVAKPDHKRDEKEEEEEDATTTVIEAAPSLAAKRRARLAEEQAAKEAAARRLAAGNAGTTKEPSRHALLKKKRAAKKYGDQSEEERRLAMLTLGHRPAAAAAAAATLPKKKANSHRQTVTMSDVEEGSYLASTLAQVEEIRQQKMAAAAAATPAATDEPTRADSDEEAEDEDEDEDDPLNKDGSGGGEHVLLDFTFAPRETERVVYALPFCGPVAAMTQFKHHVKLTPGNLKKGKAAKAAVELLSQKASVVREKEAMLEVTDPMMVQVMLGEVKVAPWVAGEKGKSSGKGGKSGGAAKAKKQDNA